MNFQYTEQKEIPVHHELLKKIVIDNSLIKIGMLSEEDTSLNNFINYLVNVNPYMFFTIENIINITNYINDNINIREFIFNLTDIIVIDYLGNNGDLDQIVTLIKNTIFINKNKGGLLDETNSYRKLYDSKISQSLYLDQDVLTELLENNSFMIILYYVATYSHELLKETKIN